MIVHLADAADVLRRVERRPGVSYVILMPNSKGFDRFEVCQKEGYGGDEIILMISAGLLTLLFILGTLSQINPLGWRHGWAMMTFTVATLVPSYVRFTPV